LEHIWKFLLISFGNKVLGHLINSKVEGFLVRESLTLEFPQDL